MSGHTPGPWHTTRWSTPTGIIRRGVFHRGGRLAMVDGGTDAGTHEQVDANARLIAAAPEMAALLDLARGWLNAADASEDDGEDEATMDAGHAFTIALRAFDAKAEGREP